AIPGTVTVGIPGTIPDLVHGGGFGRCQTVRVGRRTTVRLADKGSGAVSARARVLDEAVAYPILKVACRSRRAGNGIELGRRDGRGDFVVHHDRRPQLGGDEPIPVVGIRAGENSVEVLREVLRLIVTLATAGRTAHPVLADWFCAVVRRCKV